MRRPLWITSARFLLVLACVSLWTCGGGGGSDGPTVPSDFVLTFGGQITNTSARQTLGEIELLLDGRVIATRAATNSSFNIPFLALERVRRGEHEFAVRLTRQSSSPNRYLVAGGVDGVDSNGTKVVDVDFSPRNLVLATGELVAWTFTF